MDPVGGRPPPHPAPPRQWPRVHIGSGRCPRLPERRLARDGALLQMAVGTEPGEPLGTRIALNLDGHLQRFSHNLRLNPSEASRTEQQGTEEDMSSHRESRCSVYV